MTRTYRVYTPQITFDKIDVGARFTCGGGSVYIKTRPITINGIEYQCVSEFDRKLYIVHNHDMVQRVG